MKAFVTNTEAEIMEVLWDHEEGMTFKDMLDYFNTQMKKDWKKQTLNTYLHKLTGRKFIRTDDKPKKTIYYPGLTRQEFKQCMAKDILDGMYNGSIRNFVAALTGGERISDQDAAELRNLLEE